MVYGHGQPNKAEMAFGICLSDWMIFLGKWVWKWIREAIQIETKPYFEMKSKYWFSDFDPRGGVGTKPG